ncbi:hypothetical protein BDV97DRAFT_394610 [Delphinella strobiligena]|nr:hypothetical protein BDV97DRAFT_394610 [Delphinella strobiligena]
MAPSQKSTLKEAAQENASRLGDPVSLKAETSETEPTENDRPNKGGQHKSLKQIAQEKNETNPSMLGDPISLKAETSDSEPTENDRGAGQTQAEKTGKPKL